MVMRPISIVNATMATMGTNSTAISGATAPRRRLSRCASRIAHVPLCDREKGTSPFRVSEPLLPLTDHVAVFGFQVRDGRRQEPAEHPADVVHTDRYGHPNQIALLGAGNVVAARAGRVPVGRTRRPHTAVAGNLDGDLGIGAGAHRRAEVI